MTVSLEKFYLRLQREAEGIADPQPLVGSWDASRRSLIAQGFRAAFVQGGMRHARIPDFQTRPDGTPRENQSKGNAAAKFVVERLNAHGDVLRAVQCGRDGYPDTLLSMATDGFACCMEIKATSAWNPRDSNRRVLTSSSATLRRLMKEGRVPSPPLHLLLTLEYDNAEGWLDALRLHFLEPATPVNVRLEASTSQRLLSGNGQHCERIA